jgi:hypothetical protein
VETREVAQCGGKDWRGLRHLHFIDLMEKGNVTLLCSLFTIGVWPNELGGHLGEVREATLAPVYLLASVVHQLIEMVLLKLP